MKIFILFLATLVSAFGAQQGVLYDSNTRITTPSDLNYRADDLNYTGIAAAAPVTLGGVAVNWSTGTVFKRTMLATETYTFNTPTDGQSIVIYVTNPSNFSVNWPTVTWDGLVTPTQSANATDTYVFSYVNGIYYGSFLPGTVRKIDLSNTAQVTGLLDASLFPALTGDVTTGGGSLATTLINTGISGTYRSVTTDGQGRVTAGTAPTTFGDYFISDTSANFLTAITDATGTGLVMGNNTPTIVTPTIASFTNAQHNHQTAAGGGTLAASALTGVPVYTNLAPAFTGLTDGSTITLTVVTNNAVQNFVVTLGGNRTLAISGAVSGATGVLIVNQDGTGIRTLALPGSSKVIGGGSGAITLTTNANAIDILTWVYNGTNYFWNKGLNYN